MVICQGTQILREFCYCPSCTSPSPATTPQISFFFMPPFATGRHAMAATSATAAAAAALSHVLYKENGKQTKQFYNRPKNRRRNMRGTRHTGATRGTVELCIRCRHYAQKGNHTGARRTEELNKPRAGALQPAKQRRRHDDLDLHESKNSIYN
uniref:Uncharacterized protein n=1 Tax=Zea mays TaxID=4577 RepID=C0P6V7_MAIZE|nr:unknown [Zea mays]